ncbi:MAG: diaminopropionate ammonia-lyase [Chloroflexales bacterium]
MTTDIFYSARRSAPAALAFHRRLPGYAPTPVVEAPALAARLGIGRLSLKLETDRLGLPSFKILGASYAAYRALCARLGGEPAWAVPDDLRAAVAPLRPLTLLAATDGNHGRAVARMAALLGLRARIFVPADMALARMGAIIGEGAELEVVHGSYDDAVALSAAAAGPQALVISDTAWPGYEQTPRDVIAGYGTIFQEADAALGSPPDLVAVQMGVGALAAAVIGHYRRRGAGPTIVGVEPDQAACVLASLRAGEIREVPGPHRSIMAGLNCGLPSPVAWPILHTGLDAALAVPDDLARAAMRALAAEGVSAGETGAAGVAGLIALCEDSEARARLGIGPHTHALAIITEGVTDPAAYAQIVG